MQIRPDSLIIISNVSETDYESFANEDLKLDYDGECLYIHSPATFEHEQLVFTILKSLKEYLNVPPRIGEAVGSRFSIMLKNGKRVEPDVVVIPFGSVQKRVSLFKGKTILICEILSPSTRSHDIERKLNWYQESDVPEIWYYDPEAKTMTSYYLQSNHHYLEEVHREGIFNGKVLPGYRLDLADLI